MNIHQYIKAVGFENARKKFRVKAITLTQYCTGRRLPRPETMLRIYHATKGEVSTKEQIEYFLARQKLMARYAREGRRMTALRMN